jgi:hypothetical protein
MRNRFAIVGDGKLNALFFAAGPAGGTHGAYGRIDSR